MKCYFQDLSLGKTEESPSKRQRHSVEVSLSAYMNANNLETFKVGSSAAPVAAASAAGCSVSMSSSNANRNIRDIPEDEFVSNSLPPTIKLLVYLWDEIKSYCIQAILQQMIVASPSVNVKSYNSKKEKSSSKSSRKGKSRDEIYVDPKEAEAASTAAKVLEEAFHQLCEMCGHYFQVKQTNFHTHNSSIQMYHFQHPVTYHMKTAHPGCGGHAGSKGYNSGGHYCGGWAGNCGDGGVGGSSWYLICEKCRALHMSRSRQQQPQHVDIDAKNRANLKQPQPLRKKSFTLSASAAAAATNASPGQMNSHIIMTNNAMFLLDLASASNSNLVNVNRSSKMTTSFGCSLSSVSELGGMDPNPFPLVPFQCFNKLGVRDSHLRLINDELVLDEVLKSNNESTVKELTTSEAAAAASEITPPEQFQNSFTSSKKPFSRSASVGNQVLNHDPRKRNSR